MTVVMIGRVSRPILPIQAVERGRRWIDHPLIGMGGHRRIWVGRVSGYRPLSVYDFEPITRLRYEGQIATLTLF